jgi:uncharacterized protein YukE
VSPIVVDLEQLAELVAGIETFQHHLSRVGQDVDARGKTLPWTGRAAAEHAHAQARWAAGAAEVQAALAVLRSIAVTAHANYEAAALANRRMWAQ